MDSLSDIETSLSGPLKKMKTGLGSRQGHQLCNEGRVFSFPFTSATVGGVTGSGCGLAARMINRNKIAITICVSENIRKVESPRTPLRVENSCRRIDALLCWAWVRLDLYELSQPGFSLKITFFSRVTRYEAYTPATNKRRCLFDVPLPDAP